MKFSLSIAALAATTASAHTIFQRVSVDGVDQGQQFGVRSASSNNPIEDVTSAGLTCNINLASPVSTKVISVAAGAKVGTYWQHNLGQNSPDDADNPIAGSHKGPVQIYLAKVDDAGTAETASLKWTKVASEGLDKGVWGIDNLITGDGWWYFTLPSCIAPGDYLMRAELIALHNAYSAGGAQFYVSCANIRVTGSGTQSLSGGVSFPGAYAAADPGITISIYGSSGNPDNDGKPYVAPGPAVLSCGGAGGNTQIVVPTSSKAAATSSKAAATTTLVPVTTPPSTGGTPPSTDGAALYGQCGGKGWAGPTACASGTCTVGNDYYSQCLP